MPIALVYKVCIEGPKKSQKHKDPTNHDFWYPPCIGPWDQTVRSLCLCGPLGPWYKVMQDFSSTVPCLFSGRGAVNYQPPPATSRGLQGVPELVDEGAVIPSTPVLKLEVSVPTLWHGMAWHGMAWHGMVWYGMVWYDTV